MSVAKSLSEEQISQIQQWADGEVGLSGIQQRLADSFEVKLTYMETRFLIDDLGIKMPEEEEKTEPEESESGLIGEEPEPDGSDQSKLADASETGEDSATSGSVTVTISELQRPGAMVSGRVTFSNGEEGEWYMDQMGRLALNPDNAEYKPTESDMLDFQKELQRVAKEKGF